MANRRKKKERRDFRDVLTDVSEPVRRTWISENFSLNDAFPSADAEAKQRQAWIDANLSGDEKQYNAIQAEHRRLAQQTNDAQEIMWMDATGNAMSWTRFFREQLAHVVADPLSRAFWVQKKLDDLAARQGKQWQKFESESMRLTHLIEGQPVPVLIFPWDNRFKSRTWKPDSVSRPYVFALGRIVREFSEASNTVRVQLMLPAYQTRLWLPDGMHPERFVRIQPATVTFKPSRQELGWVSATFRGEPLQYLIPLAGPALQLVRTDAAIRRSARDLLRLAQHSPLPGSILPLLPPIFRLAGFPTPLGFKP